MRKPVALVESGSEQGTAFVLGESGGQLYLLTALHVIDDPDDIRLTFWGRQTAVAQVVDSYQEMDLAALRCALPVGMDAPASFLPANEAPVFDQNIKVVGHPYGETWDIVSGTIKSPSTLGRRFTTTPTGIDMGCSGGPVLTSDYTLLGMVQETSRTKATCRNLDALLEACRFWQVPTNLMTGIPEEKAIDPIDTEYVLSMQQAQTAWNAQQWATAKRAYSKADHLRPSSTLKARIKACEAEMQKDQSYRELRDQGLAAVDLNTALGFYQQAQQWRDTEEIRGLIVRTEELLGEIAPQSLVVSNEPPTSYTDPWAGEMVLVKGGAFMMGSEEGDDDEKPVHRVAVGDFYMGKYEVTQAQWKAIMGENPSYFKDCDQCPVESVSWEDVQEFIQKLNEKTGHTYRLPTEAEWEYAAGGGENGRTKWAGTDEEAELSQYANFCDKNCMYSWAEKFQDDGFANTAPVGQGKRLPNALGLYDMSGNVWEWCQDWYHASYKNAPNDGSAWENPVGSSRVVRGGSWRNGGPVGCRVANRSDSAPGSRVYSVGFRLSRTL